MRRPREGGLRRARTSYARLTARGVPASVPENEDTLTDERILCAYAAGYAGGCQAAGARVSNSRPPDGVQRSIDLQRDGASRASPRGLRLSRGAARQSRGRQVLEREHLPQDQSECPRA